MTDRYAVAGNPVEHSLSPQIHTLFAQQTDQDLAYSRLLLFAEGFQQGVRDFFAEGGAGLNITVPFKEVAFRMAERLSERAKLAEAVNTLKIEPDGTLSGDNTDGAGLVCDIRDNHQISFQGKRILILGAGGAVKGVLGPILKEQPEQVVIANRTAKKAEQLAKQYQSLGAIVGGGFDVEGEGFDLVINGTSASLGGEVPPIPKQVIGAQTVVYDMMYGAKPTVFLTWAEAQGAGKVIDGLGMLVEQAAEAFCFWRGIHPQTGPVLATLRSQLNEADQ